MSLRDPAEVALNRLHVALRRAADHYQHFAESVDDPALAGLLRELAPDRARRAAEVEEQIRGIGLPRMPNPEREALERAVAAFKAALVGEARTALISNLEALEQDIASASTAALQEPLPDPARHLVRSLALDLPGIQERFLSLH